MPAGQIKGIWLTLGANAIKRTNKAMNAIKRTNKATNAIKRTNKTVDGFEWQTRVSQTIYWKSVTNAQGSLKLEIIALHIMCLLQCLVYVTNVHGSVKLEIIALHFVCYKCTWFREVGNYCFALPIYGLGHPCLPLKTVHSLV